MNYIYIILDDDFDCVERIRIIVGEFLELNFIVFVNNYIDGLNLILKYILDLIFLEIDLKDKVSGFLLNLINGLLMYLKEILKIVIIIKRKDLVFDCI